jgi:hypothetical protein
MKLMARTPAPVFPGRQAISLCGFSPLANLRQTHT